MDQTVVLKFGGSSVADNLKLNVVAKKIIDFYNENDGVVVVVSAQGKTTDSLIKEAKELSNLPDDREMDVLLSTGEQVSMSKLAILLKRLGVDSISLTGWQAGIYTSMDNQNAKIESIDVTRIKEELEKKKVVIIAGFQGINENGDITTLGRGGSDTTAVAIAAAINARHCYIFSDVDGVYTTDPNKITIAKKLETLSYEEMLEIANEGARVLHNRCIEVGKKYKIPVIAKSTFNNMPGSIIQDKMEDTGVKSIVKNDDIVYIQTKYETYKPEFLNNIIKLLIDNKIEANYFHNNSKHSMELYYIIKSNDLNKFQNLLENELKSFDISYKNVSRIAIVGYGMTNDSTILPRVMKLIETNNLEIVNLEINQYKIAITFNDKLQNNILEQFHKELII